MSITLPPVKKVHPAIAIEQHELSQEVASKIEDTKWWVNEDKGNAARVQMRCGNRIMPFDEFSRCLGYIFNPDGKGDVASLGPAFIAQSKTALERLFTYDKDYEATDAYIAFLVEAVQ